MRTNSNQFGEIIQEDEGLDFVNLFQKALSLWYLFLIFGLIGVSGAYVYTKIEQTLYEVETTLIIKVMLLELE